MAIPTLAGLDGFEHGTVATGTGGVPDVTASTPTIVTSTPRSGARCLEFVTAGAAVQYRYNSPASTRRIIESFYVRFVTSIPTGVTTLFLFTNASGNGTLRFNSANSRFEISCGGGAQVAVGPNPVVANTWYRIDLNYNCSANPHTLDARVDGGSNAQATGAVAAADCTVHGFSTSAATVGTIRFDDWVWSFTAADYPIGEHQVESKIPSSDGSHNIGTSGDFDSFTGTAFSNATTNGNTFIGHRPLQRANTADQVIRQELGTTAHYMEFGLENITDADDVPGDVRAYATHIESATTGASLAEARLLLADATEVLTVGSLSVIDTSEDPGTTVSVRRRMCIRPSGGWDRTKVNGLLARVGFGDNAPDVNFIDFMIEVALFPPTAQTITVGQATETDTGQAISHTKTVQVGQASETDTGQSVRPLRTRSIGIAAETDTGQAVGHSKTRPVGQATETDTGGAIRPLRIHVVGQATETDTGQPVGHSKTVQVAQALETDSAGVTTPRRTLAVGTATETDTAGSATPRRTVVVGQAVETDVGLEITPALQGEQVIEVRQASETDSAQPVAHSKTVQVGQATETDTGQVVGHRKTAHVGQATETDVGLTVTPQVEGQQTVAVGQAIETDTAQPLGRAKVAHVAQASETDTAQAVGPEKTVRIGQASETDAAQPITGALAQVVLLGQARETDTALLIRILRREAAPQRDYDPGRGVPRHTAAPASSRFAGSGAASRFARSGSAPPEGGG